MGEIPSGVNPEAPRISLVGRIADRLPVIGSLKRSIRTSEAEVATLTHDIVELDTQIIDLEAERAARTTFWDERIKTFDKRF